MFPGHQAHRYFIVYEGSGRQKQAGLLNEDRSWLPQIIATSGDTKGDQCVVYQHLRARLWFCVAEQNTTTVVGLFTKIDGTYRIKKRQNISLPSSSSTSPMRICAFIYALSIQRREWFLKMCDNSICDLVNSCTVSVKARRRGCQVRVGETGGNCPFHFWVHNRKVGPCFSVPQTVLTPAAKRCSAFAHIDEVHFHFFWNLPGFIFFYFFFLTWVGNVRIPGGHFLPLSHTVYSVFPAVDAPWMWW